MSDMSSHFSIPKGLVVADPIKFEHKVAKFATLGAAGIHVVFDFDRTLTVKMPGTHNEVTTWHILREYLSQDAQTEYQRLFEKYRALELSGNMTPQNAVDWWSSILNLFVEHRIDLNAVETTFLERASIRPGTAELFKLFTECNIPSVILSAGIREVIDIWCRKYDIRPSLVVSTHLTIDDHGLISGWQENTLVHALNKSEATHPELLEIRKNRPNVLIVGDSLDDASMAVGEQSVVRVRILDPRGDELATEKEERNTFERFDALIQTGSLDPLQQLIELII